MAQKGLHLVHRQFPGSVQGESGKIIGGRIIQDEPQDGKQKNGQLESCLIFYNISLCCSA